MPEALRLFPRPQGPHCPPCQLLEVCGSDLTDNACVPEFDPDGPGGPFALHPLRTDFDEHFARVGGALLDDVPGYSIHLPSLGPYLPQVKWLERLRSEHVSARSFPTVAVRIKEVFRGGRIRSADELRAETGLADDVAFVLLLHGKDLLLELLNEARIISDIASGGYDLVTAPSFSLWEPRRRPDNVLSLRRSFRYYAELRRAGVNICPRVGWVEARDVERLAAWVNRHAIGLVSLDLMTYDGPSFDRAIAHLATFDELTESCCHYLVDGVRARQKIEALYLASAPDRVTVSNATMAPPPGESGDSLIARACLTMKYCAAARDAVRAAHASSVEAFIADATQGKRSAPITQVRV
jgi:hypothetical protein